MRSHASVGELFGVFILMIALAVVLSIQLAKLGSKVTDLQTRTPPVVVCGKVPA